MKIDLIKPYGYCAGVASAIDIAFKAKNENPDKNIVVLGMLVHNDDALMALKKAGITTIYKKDKQLVELINYVPSNSIVILTAHGHSKEVENELNKRNIKFIDATCPFVEMAHSAIKEAVSNNLEIIYIGKSGHPEALSSLSISENVYLFDLETKVIPTIKTKNPLIISQTTFSNDEVQESISLIKEKYPEAKELKGICHASESRQKALLSLDKDVELIYIVGGVNSNNTQTLMRLAKANFPNSKVIAIQNESDINEKDLKGLSHVAISSGASTPSEISLKIHKKIELLCN